MINHTFFLLITLLSLSVLSADSKQPNIILLMGDDHGYDETGYNGHPYVKTPFLDEMAEQGLRLDRFYSAASTCSPTRGSVLTGRHPIRYGIFSPGYSIRPEEVTIAQLLKKKGYATAHFGKWHIGPVKASSPTGPRALGFDENLSHDNFFEMDPTFSRNGGEPKKFYGESSEIVVDEALKFIEKTKQPFFVIIWYGSPHEPYSGLETDKALYKDLPQKYSERKVKLTSNETGLRVERPLRDVLIERYAEITAMDRSIGKLRNALKTLGLKQDTLLWYCSDNGIPTSAVRESKLRGQKGTLYENGIRVPSVLEWPAGIQKAKRSSFLSVSSDLLPTLCDITQTQSSHLPLDGISLKGCFDGTMTERPKALTFWRFKANRSEQSQLKAYLPAELQRGTTPLVKQSKGLFTRNFTNYHYTDIKEEHYLGPRVIMNNDYKLVIDASKNKVELFNINKDESETQNLAQTHPEVVKELSQQLRGWQDQVLNSLQEKDYQK